MESLKNQLLIATSMLIDSRFERSVIYLCEHTEEGAFGIVINQPTPITLKELLNQMQIAPQPHHSDRVMVVDGGPVEQSHGMVLHPALQQWHSTLFVSAQFAVTTSRDILEALASDRAPDHYLISLGYAGWGAGQLEQELLENSWLNAPATTEILFTAPYAERWQLATRQLGFDPGQLCYAGHA